MCFGIHGAICLFERKMKKDKFIRIRHNGYDQAGLRTEACGCPQCLLPDFSKDIKCMTEKCKITKEQLDFCKEGVLMFFDISSVKKVGYRGKPPALPSDMLYHIPHPPGVDTKKLYVYHPFPDRQPGQ